MAETSRLLFPSFRFGIVSSLIAIAYASSVSLQLETEDRLSGYPNPAYSLPIPVAV
jgi:hypothetical protein